MRHRVLLPRLEIMTTTRLSGFPSPAATRKLVIVVAVMEVTPAAGSSGASNLAVRPGRESIVRKGGVVSKCGRNLCRRDW